MITISLEAKEFISKILNSSGKDAVKLDIDYAGCTGYKYEFAAISTSDIEPTDKVVETEFGHLVVTESAAPLVVGAEIILTKNGLNTELEVVNPNETARCGCGKSFAI